MFWDHYEQHGSHLPDCQLLHCPLWRKEDVQQSEAFKRHRRRVEKHFYPLLSIYGCFMSLWKCTGVCLTQSLHTPSIFPCMLTPPPIPTLASSGGWSWSPNPFTTLLWTSASAAVTASAKREEKSADFWTKILEWPTALYKHYFQGKPG